MTFVDGPAAGEGFMVRRAPLFLRAVVSAMGKWDVLDQLDDEPRDDERVFVYRCASPVTVAFVRPGGRYEIAHYRYVEDAPTEELRDTQAWRAWVGEQVGERIDPATGAAVASAS